jgi:hypothetical protein
MSVPHASKFPPVSWQSVTALTAEDVASIDAAGAIGTFPPFSIVMKRAASLGVIFASLWCLCVFLGFDSM